MQQINRSLFIFLIFLLFMSSFYPALEAYASDSGIFELAQCRRRRRVYKTCPLKRKKANPKTLIINKNAKSSSKKPTVNGLDTKYYSNGNIQVERIFQEGKLHGEYNQYYKDGSLKKAAYYQEGLLEGDMVIYNKDGSIKQQRYYEQGKLVEKVNY